MGGGLLQLVAYGAQDAYLSGNPQITFWKGLFKRHTNFAMEAFRVPLTGTPAWGTKQTAVIPRHADLLYSTYIEVVLQAGSYNNDQRRLGFNLIKYAELDIGGQLIDRLYGEWLFLWDSLSSTGPKGLLLGSMSSPERSPVVNISSPVQCNTGNGRPSMPTVLYIPIGFFYTRNPSCALPLIALQYHEVKINILWNDPQFVSAIASSSMVAPSQVALFVDYIYLDVEERRRMAQQSHEYLIEQLQFNEDKGISSYNNRIDLTFNHPVKELVWVVQPEKYTNCKLNPPNTRLQPFTYGGNPVYEQYLQINGQDRMEPRYGDYFNKVQIYQHHTGFGSNDVYYSEKPQSALYCYSFALKPEEHQPSGTCNFSRIDTATLVVNMSGSVAVSADSDDTWNVRVYAVNYNVLRIMSGMAGLAYSN